MAIDKYNGPERRSYMRLDTDCAVDYVKLTDELKPIHDIIDSAYSKNISGAGVKFLAKEKIPLGTFLELHIKIPGADKYLTAMGRVLRCEEEKGKNYGIAIAFIWINKRDRELLDEYVRNQRLEKLRDKIKE